MKVEDREVPLERLTQRCDASELGFDTTEEIDPLEGTIGQQRAVSALEMGLDIDARGFNLDNGALITGLHQTMLQAAVTAGFRVHVQPRDIDIKIYGNVAVTVAYLDGSITLPGGEPRPGTWRYSETRVKIDGIWKVVQYHISPMAARASRR